MTTPSRNRLRRVVELALRAPSVHNTQPWRWRLVDRSTLELLADRSRQLSMADPFGRNLALSCGAALHHAVHGAEAMGLAPKVDLLPEGAEEDLLATIRFSAGVAPRDADARLAALDERCTDRRRFTSWPVPDSRLHRLAERASGWGAYAIPVTDVTARFRVELLLERAMMLQAADGRFAAEQAEWVQSHRRDGVPLPNALPPGHQPERPNRFVGIATEAMGSRVVESSDGLIAICTAKDDLRSWLQAGETMSALWLDATRAGLSIVPLSQVVEVPETLRILHEDVFAGMARPQILLRVGWQEIARTTLPRTPRRPIEDVLEG
jgi:nitroreductase